MAYVAKRQLMMEFRQQTWIPVFNSNTCLFKIGKIGRQRKHGSDPAGFRKQGSFDVSFPK